MKRNPVKTRHSAITPVCEALEGRLLMTTAAWWAPIVAAPKPPASVLLPMLNAGAAKTTTTTVADDFGNTISTAGAVFLDAQGSAALAGKINYFGDVDVLSLVATQTGSMQISLVPLTGRKNNVSGSLTVYDSAAAVIVQDVDGSNTRAGATFTVTAGQTYYVRITALSGTGG